VRFVSGRVLTLEKQPASSAATVLPFVIDTWTRVAVRTDSQGSLLVVGGNSDRIAERCKRITSIEMGLESPLWALRPSSASSRSRLTRASSIGAPAYPTCPGNRDPAVDDLNDSANTKGNIATIAVLSGVVLGDIGAVLLLTARR
jgi:hypothetical protein